MDLTTIGFIAVIFLPSVIALGRSHPNTLAILILNVFSLGAFFFMVWIGVIGMLISLIWSLSAIQRAMTMEEMIAMNQAYNEMYNEQAAKNEEKE